MLKVSGSMTMRSTSVCFRNRKRNDSVTNPDSRSILRAVTRPRKTCIVSRVRPASRKTRLGLLLLRLRPKPIVLQGRPFHCQRIEPLLLFAERLFQSRDLRLVFRRDISLGEPCLQYRAIRDEPLDDVEAQERLD